VDRERPDGAVGVERRTDADDPAAYPPRPLRGVSHHARVRGTGRAPRDRVRSRAVSGRAAFDRLPHATVAFEGVGLHAATAVGCFDHDLDPFHDDLGLAHTVLRGAAAIGSEEGGFALRVVCANGGEVALSGHVRPEILDPSRLTFEIGTDQSYLDPAVRTLRDRLRAKPGAAPGNAAIDG